MFPDKHAECHRSRTLEETIRESDALAVGSLAYSHGAHDGPAASMRPAGRASVDSGGDGGSGQAKAAGEYMSQEIDFMRPSFSPSVESAEEILQAVEAQLDQSPLLSRRSSVSMSIGMRAARSGRAAWSGGGSSTPGASTPSASVPSTSPHPQLLAQQQLSYIAAGTSLMDHYLQTVAAAAAAAATTAATTALPAPLTAPVAAAVALDRGGPADPGGGVVQPDALVSTASFSAGVMDAACDAAVATAATASTAQNGTESGSGTDIVDISVSGGGGTIAGGGHLSSTAVPYGAPSAEAGTATMPWQTGHIASAAATVATGAFPSSPSSQNDTAIPAGSRLQGADIAAADSGNKGAGAGPSSLAPAAGTFSISSPPPPHLSPPPAPLQSQTVAAATQRAYGSVIVAPSRLSQAAGGAGGAEKKVVIAGVRTWLKVLPDGSASIVQLDRAQLGMRFGVQLRDFRVLDPVLGATYPACLLCREGALIVNLDHIKVIITAQFALVNHSDADKARPFTEELKRRLQQYAASRTTLGLLAGTNESTSQPHALRADAPGANGSAGGGGKGGIWAGLTAPIPRFSSSPALMAQAAAVGPSAGSTGGRPGPSLASVSTSHAAAAAAGAEAQGPQPSSLGPMAHVASALMSILPHTRHQQQHLHQQLQRHQQEHQPLLPKAAAGGHSFSSSVATTTTTFPHATPVPAFAGAMLWGTAAGGGGGGSGGGGVSVEGPQVSEQVASMPFELRALEVVLEQTVSLLDGQTTELERATRMALDELTLRVNPRNLERMRHLKGRMAALSNKVDTVRGVLEKLLDDDRAMAAMNLTAKEEQAAAAAEAAAAREASQLSAPSGLYPGGSSTLLTPLELQQLAALRGSSPPLGHEQMSGQLAGAYYEAGDPDSEEVAVVEMLLEAYFMQLGHTWQRLQSLKSYIDSTEDLINLELDQQRNNLISVDLMVTFASFLLTAMSVIAGLFGMNVTNRMETDYSAFLSICIGSAAAAVTLWLLFVYCSIRYGLMNGLSMTWR